MGISSVGHKWKFQKKNGLRVLGMESASNP